MKVKVIDLNTHPKLRATLLRALKTQRKRAATRAKKRAAKNR
jgi:hypothetical protein